MRLIWIQSRILGGTPCGGTKRKKKRKPKEEEVWLFRDGLKSIHKVFPDETPCASGGAYLCGQTGRRGVPVGARAEADSTVRLNFSPVVNAAGEALKADVFEVLYLQAGSHGVWAGPPSSGGGTLQLKAGRPKRCYGVFIQKRKTRPENTRKRGSGGGGRREACVPADSHGMGFRAWPRPAARPLLGFGRMCWRSFTV